MGCSICLLVSYVRCGSAMLCCFFRFVHSICFVNSHELKFNDFSGCFFSTMDKKPATNILWIVLMAHDKNIYIFLNVNVSLRDVPLVFSVAKNFYLSTDNLCWTESTLSKRYIIYTIGHNCVYVGMKESHRFCQLLLLSICCAIFAIAKWWLWTVDGSKKF